MRWGSPQERVSVKAGGGISGRGEAVAEVEEVVGVLPGGVESDDQVEEPVPLDDAFEALAERCGASGRLGDGELGGGGLEVVAEEGGVVAVA